MSNQRDKLLARCMSFDKEGRLRTVFTRSRKKTCAMSCTRVERIGVETYCQLCANFSLFRLKEATHLS